MAGHVYLIGSPTFCWYKIGKSGNAAIRVTELGILLPFRIEVVAVWKVSNHHQVEKLLHEKYRENRINGEWFKFASREIAALVESMKSVEVEAAKGFSNIERDSVNLRRVVTVNTPLEERDTTVTRCRGGAQVRIDQLTKQNAELKATIQKLLDNQKLPTV